MHRLRYDPTVSCIGLKPCWICSLTPYLGYEALLILSSTSVLDASPNCDEYPIDEYNMGCPDGDEEQAEFVFNQQDAILRHRPYFGMRMIFSVMRLTFEGMLAPAGSSQATVDGQTVTDSSQLQQQYTLSIGLDF